MNLNQIGLRILALFICLGAPFAPATAGQLYVDPDDAGTLYWCGAGMKISRDFGKSWAVRSSYFTCYDMALGPRVGGDRLMYAAGYGYGVKRSTDGINWIDSPSFPGDVWSVAAHPDGNTVFAGGEGEIYVSYDKANSWQVLATIEDSDRRFYFMEIDPLNPNNLYAGNYRSTDGGITWTNEYEGDPGFSHVAVSPVNSGVLFSAGFHGIHRSVDAGASWWHTFTLPASKFNQIRIFPGNTEVVIGITDYHGIWRSIDGGQSWEVSLSDQSTVAELRSIAVAHDDSGIAYVPVPGADELGNYGPVILISRDFGASWQDTADGEPIDQIDPIGDNGQSNGNVGLSVTKLSGATVNAGSSAKFRITFTNGELYSLSNPMVLLNWGRDGKWNIDSRSAVPTQGSCDEGTCLLGSVGAGQSVSIEFSGSTAPGVATTYVLEATHQSSYLPITDSASIKTTGAAGGSKSSSGSSDGGGGGSIGWLLLVSLASVSLIRRRDRQKRTSVLEL